MCERAMRLSWITRKFLKILRRWRKWTHVVTLRDVYESSARILGSMNPDSWQREYGYETEKLDPVVVSGPLFRIILDMNR